LKRENETMQTNRIEVSKKGTGKTLYIPLCVFKAGKKSYTISCSDPKHLFKGTTSDAQLQRFKRWVAEVFEERINSN
jgi:hypothetical protein